jgi:trk system potassium uptake protein TrkA
VNNPKNIAVFMQLGVDSVVSSTAHIADIIETEVDWAGINRRLAKKLGHVRIREFHVGRDAKIANKRIADLNLPKGTIFIAVIRGSEAIVPDGQTVILKDDDVIVLSSNDNMKDLAAYF